LSQGSLELPIRLVPLNEWQSNLALAVMGFLVVGTIPLILAVKGEGDWVGYALPGYFSIAIVACLVGAWQRSRRNSPWFHLEITPQAVAVASGFRRRSCKWTQLSPFIVAERPEGESSVGYYVVASIDDQKRGSHRRIDFRAANYIADDAGSGARQLADWLNALRQQALDHGGTTLDRVTPPAHLHNHPLVCQ
jgi:hypothetical protein